MSVWRIDLLPASRAKAGIMEADAMLAGAAQLNKETMNKLSDDGCRSLPRVLGHLKGNQFHLDPFVDQLSKAFVSINTR